MPAGPAGPAGPAQPECQSAGVHHRKNASGVHIVYTDTVHTVQRGTLKHPPKRYIIV